MVRTLTERMPRTGRAPHGTGTPVRPRPPAAPAAAPSSVLGFGLFLLVNVVLLVRPAEILPDLEQVQIYEAVIVTCLLVSFRPALDQLSPPSLLARPITACVLGLLAAVGLSHLSRLALGEAHAVVVMFAKVVVYYILFVAVVDSPSRLRVFLLALVACCVALTGLALLQYHEAIDIPTLAVVQERGFDSETGEMVVFPRLRSTGIFNDPNDLCIMLAAGILLSIYWLGDRQLMLGRLVGLGALGLFGYALVLTKSRGGLLALLVGLLTFGAARLGWRKAVLLAAAALPLFAAVSGGRQTSFDTGAGTAQERIQIWSRGLELFREQPLFGIGVGQYGEQLGHVAHNSFVHCFVELGLIGGTCFVGIFYCLFQSLRRLGAAPTAVHDLELRRLRPYLVAILAAYATGLFSLTRCYTVSTYLFVGLAAAYVQVAAARLPRPPLPLDVRLARHLAVVSVVTLIALYAFVRFSVRWS